MTTTQPDERFTYFAADAMLLRLRQLMKEREGIKLADDIEYIHRMRVASRRLRSALDHFEECFPKKQLKKWKAFIKKVTKTLGAARDLDVQIDFLESFEHAHEDDEKQMKKGVDRLLLRLRQQRKRQQKHVTAMADMIAGDSIIAEMDETLRGIIVSAKLNNATDPSPYGRKKAAEVAAVRLEELLSFETYVHQPELVEELHEMRIAAKHLRYTLEIFEPLFALKIKKYIKAVKQVQEYLGDIHDCDVWIAHLPDFLEDEEAFTEEYYGHTRGFKRIKEGVLYLFEERKKTRTEIYDAFIAYWKKLREEDVWNDLRDIARRTLAMKAQKPSKATTKKRASTKKVAPNEEHDEVVAPDAMQEDVTPPTHSPEERAPEIASTEQDDASNEGESTQTKTSSDEDALRE